MYNIRLKGAVFFMIGDTLKQERENQNLSLQDVEQGTSIRALYIEAIESGDYDKLPGEVYAKGFIKNYANFLNLDGDALVKQFIQEISPATTIPAENPASAESKPAEEIKTAEPDEDSITTPRSKRRNKSESEETDSRKYIIAAALVLLLVGGIFYGFSGSGEEPPAVTQNEENQPADNPQVAQVTPPEPQPVAQPPADNVSLQATFSGDCWTQVVIDGALIYEGMINAGQVFDWTGNQSVYVVLGNAGAVNFVMNGQNIGTLGEEGAVVERNFVR